MTVHQFPVAPSETDTRTALRWHLQRRAMLELADRKHYTTPPAAFRSAKALLGWTLATIWQDSPAFMLLGVVSVLWLVGHLLVGLL